MTDARFILKEPIDWKDAMVFLAFPSPGSAPTIAIHYLQRRLDLPLVGSIHIENQSPVAAVYNGIASSPIRIHGGKTECKLGDERCPTVYLITSDLPLGPEATSLIGEAIMQETRGAKLVLSLDSVIRQEKDEKPDMYAAASSESILSVLTLDDVEPMSQAILVGMSGEVLLQAEAAGLPAGALLVEAEESLPDGRAAAVLIGAVDRILPSIDIDAKPLLEEAMELEKEIADAQAQADRAKAAHGASTTYI